MAVNPSNINITVYSYAGRMNIGLVTTPEALPDPHRFLERMTTEVAVLVDHTAALMPPRDRANTLCPDESEFLRAYG